jgi:electron transport complex protein RnfG
MKETIKPAAVLLAITVVAAALLGFVHGVTKEPIERQRALDEANAIEGIFPGASEVEELAAQARDASSVTKSVKVLAGAETAGFAFYASPSGYGGSLDIIVGIAPSGAISGVRILSHAETPGLGANAASPSFLDLFKGKSGELKVAKSAPGDNEIQAITSATITSSAVVKAVNDAREIWLAIEGGGR